MNIKTKNIPILFVVALIGSVLIGMLLANIVSSSAAEPTMSYEDKVSQNVNSWYNYNHK